MSLDKLTELLQQLDNIEAIKLAEPDVLIINNDTIIMPDIDNTNSNNHDFNKDEL